MGAPLEPLQCGLSILAEERGKVKDFLTGFFVIFAHFCVFAREQSDRGKPHSLLHTVMIGTAAGALILSHRRESMQRVAENLPHGPRTLQAGSDGSAAGGGSSDLSEWQRSARDDGGYAEDIRRAPQQDPKGKRIGLPLTNILAASPLGIPLVDCRER